MTHFVLFWHIEGWCGQSGHIWSKSHMLGCAWRQGVGWEGKTGGHVLLNGDYDVLGAKKVTRQSFALKGWPGADEDDSLSGIPSSEVVDLQYMNYCINSIGLH